MSTPNPVVGFFVSELRRARQASGMTQDQLASIINYSASLVAQVETARKPPSKDFARRCDDALGTDGLLTRIIDDLLTKEVTPEWFRPWVMIEQETTSLWNYEPLLVPGLFQTEAYAYAVLRFVDEPEDSIEARVATRLSRQEILTKPDPPEVVTLIDEGVLHRPVGGPKVMAEQLDHLAELAEQMLIQVVPSSAETYHGLAGPFVIAAVGGWRWCTLMPRSGVMS